LGNAPDRLVKQIEGAEMDGFWGLSVPELVGLIGLLASAAYYALVLCSAREFSAAPSSVAAEDLPSITVLKPLKGVDVQLVENLASLCEQDYPRLQIVCGVADAADPAIAVVHALRARYPRVDIELVVDPRVHGTNYKVGNLHNMAARIKHDVVVLADSDIRVGPHYLRRLAADLRRPRAGLVTCLYRAVNANGLPTRFEALFINTDFSGMVLAARKIERPTYAFGATIALPRRVLDEIGGFLPLANYLADDYQLGQRVTARGYDLVLSREVVDTVIALESWQHLIRHQVRWARTYRICRPGGYFGSILTHGPLWALVHLCAQGFSAGAWGAVALLIALRGAAAATLARRCLRTTLSWRDWLLLLPKDLFLSLIWLVAFAGSTVAWSGRRFRVLRNGEMLDLTAGPPPWRAEPATEPEPRHARRSA
jgi:ceramide glucosyltransferase